MSETTPLQKRDDVPVKEKRAWLLAHPTEGLTVGNRGHLSAEAENAYAVANPAS